MCSEPHKCYEKIIKKPITLQRTSDTFDVLRMEYTCISRKWLKNFPRPATRSQDGDDRWQNKGLLTVDRL